MFAPFEFNATPFKEVITKTRTGFERYDGVATYFYDANGKYLGQSQPDMLSDEPGALDIFLKTFPGDKCYHELTPEQMQQAE